MVGFSVYGSICFEDRMPPASESELAFSMMRLWGEGAGRSARNYALDCCRKNDAVGFSRWHSVERIVEQVQAASKPHAGTVSGAQLPRPVPIEPRRHWFERMADMVMPALRRLRNAAIRRV